MIQTLKLVVAETIEIGEAVVWSDGQVSIRMSGVNKDVPSLVALEGIMQGCNGKILPQLLSEETEELKRAIVSLSSLITREDSGGPDINALNRRMLEMVDDPHVAQMDCVPPEEMGL